MKDKIIYILLGALVGGVVGIMISVSLASPTAPNPGHVLSCHTIKVVSEYGAYTASATCDTGTCTGGGCKTRGTRDWEVPGVPEGNGWFCKPAQSIDAEITAYAICCEAI